MLASRPGKQAVRDAEPLRAEWVAQARAAGFEALSIPAPQRRLAGMAAWDREAAIAESLERVAAESSSWLQADLAREIATLVPADAAPSAAGLVALVDELAAKAAGRCTELHPPAMDGTPRRRDGRPVSEHVTDRRLTAPAVLAQEARLLRWATGAVGTGLADEGDDARPAPPGPWPATPAARMACATSCTGGRTWRHRRPSRSSPSASPPRRRAPARR